MKTSTQLYFIFFSFWFCSCSSPTEVRDKENKNFDRIIGTWESKFLYVVKNTVDGSNTSTIINVTPEDYPQMLELQTSRSRFLENGDYIEELIGINGEVVQKIDGNWEIYGDTILIVHAEPEKSYKYHLEIKGDTAVFVGVLDYDGDGEEDDEFKGTSVKIISQNE